MIMKSIPVIVEPRFAKFVISRGVDECKTPEDVERDCREILSTYFKDDLDVMIRAVVKRGTIDIELEKEVPIGERDAINYMKRYLRTMLKGDPTPVGYFFGDDMGMLGDV